MRDAIIIGCGIIGATVAKALQNVGADVLALDAMKPMSGTSASGGHLYPPWFGEVPESDWKPALDLLDKTWGLITEDYELRGKNKRATVHRVNTSQVMAFKKTHGTVYEIGKLNNYPIVKYGRSLGPQSSSTEVEERCRLLLVSTGVWVYELIPRIKPEQKQGVSFLLTTAHVKPFMEEWAPYKQIVAHQHTQGGVWVGDGSAILKKNWTDKRTIECITRCREATGIKKATAATIHGLRPYFDHPQEQPCYFEKIGPRAFVATGAAKRGTLAAGWVAGKILEELKRRT